MDLLQSRELGCDVLCIHVSGEATCRPIKRRKGYATCVTLLRSSIEFTLVG
jgi:hypothetical protein